MRVRLLGTAAGGGFPQWNCGCPLCSKARSRDVSTPPRSQSSVAVSADGTSWFLLNASPDVRHQIESFPELLPPRGAVRGTSLEGVLVTNADLDHVLGLFMLREGGAVDVHATATVRRALEQGLRLTDVLSHYGGLRWHEPPSEPRPLPKRDGSPSGLLYEAFEVPGKLPRYAGGAAGPGSAVGYLLLDPATQGRLAFIPDLAGLTEGVLARLKGCAAVLMDGTLFDEDEMVRLGASTLTASRMAHLPVGGPSGSLEALRRLEAGLKVYLHINNTNPILCAASPESARVRDAGVAVGVDGMEFTI